MSYCKHLCGVLYPSWPCISNGAAREGTLKKGKISTPYKLQTNLKDLEDIMRSHKCCKPVIIIGNTSCKFMVSQLLGLLQDGYCTSKIPTEDCAISGTKNSCWNWIEVYDHSANYDFLLVSMWSPYVGAVAHFWCLDPKFLRLGHNRPNYSHCGK